MDIQENAMIAETLRGLHMEIRVLQSANAGLIEQVKRLEEEIQRWATAYRDLGTYKPEVKP